jgi:hypothetical protein
MSPTLIGLFTPFCNDLERSRALRMKRRKIVHIPHILWPTIERSQIIESAKQGAQHDVKLAKGEILAETSAGTTRKGDEALLTSTQGYLVRISPPRRIKCVWRWEGIPVAVHHPGTHRNGGLVCRSRSLSPFSFLTLSQLALTGSHS